MAKEMLLVKENVALLSFKPVNVTPELIEWISVRKHAF